MALTAPRKQGDFSIGVKSTFPVHLPIKAKIRDLLMPNLKKERERREEEKEKIVRAESKAQHSKYFDRAIQN